MIIWQEITDGNVTAYYTEAGEPYGLPDVYEAAPLAKMDKDRPSWAEDGKSYMKLNLTVVE